MNIGVFDSGAGGLTVLKHLLSTLPGHTFYYFGDTARVPWGCKSAETIQRYSLEIARFLLQFHIDLLVVACNTASAHALVLLQKELTIPVFGVIEPAARKAAEVNGSHIAVLGTRATIASKSYEKLLAQLTPRAQVSSIACPLLVPFIEEGLFDSQAASLVLQDYLKPLIQSPPDTLILGCTHYPLLQKSIERLLGDGIKIIDGGRALAEEVARHVSPGQHPTKTHYFVSDDPARFCPFGPLFLGQAITHINQVNL